MAQLLVWKGLNSEVRVQSLGRKNFHMIFWLIQPKPLDSYEIYSVSHLTGPVSVGDGKIPKKKVPA